MKKIPLLCALALPLFALMLLIASVSVAVSGRELPDESVENTPAVGGADAGITAVAGQAVLFRYDPVLGGFETFTLPLGANPHSVGVISDAARLDVWFTEPGTDQIGRLVYTDTGNFDLRAYPVASGARPFDLTVDAGRRMVWFTERAANRIGRFEIGVGRTVTYTTFDLDTPNSQPSGIDLAPDGSVWFTQSEPDRIGHLVVTNTADYSVTEYPVSGTGTNVGVYGVAVQSDEFVWVGETRTGTIRRLSASSGSLLKVSGLGTGGYPYHLVVDADRDFVWLTELIDNQITQVEVGTLHLANSFNITPTANLRPTGLTRVGNDQFWFSGQGSGQIGRLVYTSTNQFRFELIDLPVSDLWAMDIVSDPLGHLWTVAHAFQRIHLPLTLKNS
jgi:streptogramin lyase